MIRLFIKYLFSLYRIKKKSSKRIEEKGVSLNREEAIMRTFYERTKEENKIEKLIEKKKYKGEVRENLKWEVEIL